MVINNYKHKTHKYLLVILLAVAVLLSQTGNALGGVCNIDFSGVPYKVSKNLTMSDGRRLNVYNYSNTYVRLYNSEGTLLAEKSYGDGVNRIRAFGELPNGNVYVWIQYEDTFYYPNVEQELDGNNLNTISSVTGVDTANSLLTGKLLEYATNETGIDVQTIKSDVQIIKESITPTIISVTGVNGATATTSGSFLVHIEAYGAIEYRAKSDSGSWTEWSPSSMISMGGLSSGVRTITVEARNAAGKVSSKSMTIFSL